MAPRKATTKKPIPVEATVHADKRANLPTADAQEFVSPEVEAVPSLRYQRDPSLDPQLVWRGKDELDNTDLEVDAPPIYIQEKIDPRVLVENLRRTAADGELEPELTLFETFDGLNELDLVEFYEHEANWSNRMILGDSLQVMASLSEREALRGQVQMVYFDPPYGIKFGSNWQVSARKKDVKDGKIEDASREVEMIRAFRDTWERGIHSYLSYMRDRLAVCRDLLTQTGSIFVQIGDENVHLVRSLLDEVFGSENFVTTIIVKKKSATTPTDPVNDYVLWAARDRTKVKVNPVFEERRAPDGDAKFNTLIDRDGVHHRVRKISDEERLRLLSEGARWARVNYPIVSQDPHPVTSRDFIWNDKPYSCGPNRHWSYGQPGQMERLAIAERLFDGGGDSLGGVVYWDDWPFVSRTNIWEDFHGEPDPIYVVQTNRKIIERCLLMTTRPGDLVVDPTSGSGTTAYVAEHWGRRWITIDTSRVALTLSRERLMGAKYPYYLLADSEEGRAKEEELTGAPLPPGPTTNDIRRGFVYERVQHITLKSIANNPDIKEGMTREEIETAVKRHAEFEELVDRPIQNKKKVRVCGPFTVESLSPHRSLAFTASGDGAGPASQREAEAASAATFEQTIIENLSKAGIQNGKRDERLLFDGVEPYASAYIQAVGTRDEGEAGPSRVGIAIGPQYGTVGPTFIKDAAREAIRAKDLDLLCVLAFAFDPQAIGKTDDYVSASEDFASVAAERSLGRVPVLLVRMNADLVMGDDLKKTGAGNLFTVFGEPDIDIEMDGENEAVVTLRGVDVYDPTTGRLRSNDTDQIALWMIDSDYNGESFFVRHCYFTGGRDPYKQLRATLKADINKEAWESLYRTTSRPFPKPQTGKIAVKVINDYGDEVLKVYDVA